MAALPVNIRLLFVCLAAVSVALPVAIVGLAKVLLFLFALTALSTGWWRKAAGTWPTNWTSKAILLAMLVFAVSLIWTTAPLPDALRAVEKHGKLLLIPILLSMNPRIIPLTK